MPVNPLEFTKFALSANVQPLIKRFTESSHKLYFPVKQ